MKGALANVSIPAFLSKGQGAVEFGLQLFSESGALGGFYEERKTLGPRPRTSRIEEGIGLQPNAG